MKPSGRNVAAGVAIAAGLLAIPVRVQSQADTLARGDRVRVSRLPRPAATDWIVGTWQSRTANELVVLTPDRHAVHLPTDSIARLQVSIGHGTRWERGALVGLVAGLATGLLFEAAACSSAQADGWGEGACIAHGYVLIPSVTGGIGAVLGTAIGLGLGYERWRDLAPLGVSRAAPR